MKMVTIQIRVLEPCDLISKIDLDRCDFFLSIAGQFIRSMNKKQIISLNNPRRLVMVLVGIFESNLKRDIRMPPAARLTDMHVCPMLTGPVPHVGGPITGPGMPTVLIGGLPASVVGDLCVCVGPPDTIVKGSSTVMIGGMPSARMGDSTAHGGSIILGCPTVIVGG